MSAGLTHHLLRGAAACGLIALASFGVPDRPLLAGAALIGAIVLLRGCPMCWLATLLAKLSTPQSQRFGRHLK